VGGGVEPPNSPFHTPLLLTVVFRVIVRAALRPVRARLLCQMRAPYRPITRLPLSPIAGPQNCGPGCCSTPLMRHWLLYQPQDRRLTIGVNKKLNISSAVHRVVCLLLYSIACCFVVITSRLLAFFCPCANVVFKLQHLVHCQQCINYKC